MFKMFTEVLLIYSSQYPFKNRMHRYYYLCVLPSILDVILLYISGLELGFYLLALTDEYIQ